MNKSMLIIAAIAVVGLVGYLLMQNNQTQQTAMSPEATSAPIIDQGSQQNLPSQTIVEIAANNPDFSTLVTAVTEAGLVETLSGTGPFTVFAPTNEAFAKLPAGTIENLLADKEALTKVLTYHVVPGKVMAADVVNVSSASTVQGQDLTVKVVGDSVMINDSTVVATDIEATNGVIHVIDTVLLPR